MEIKTNKQGFLESNFKDYNNSDCTIGTGLAIEHGTNKTILGKVNLYLENNDSMGFVLTQAMAKELGEQLLYFAEHGKLKDQKDLIPYAIHFTNKQNYNYYLGIIYCDLPATDGRIKELAEKELLQIMIEKDLKRYDLCYTCLLDCEIVKFLDAPAWKQIREWLQQGQTGFYTDKGLVKVKNHNEIFK